MVKVKLAYDINDNYANGEFTERRYEIQDFLRNYFGKKYANELVPKHEEQIKKEIMERLNTQILDRAEVRGVLFDKLDLFQM
jgi:flagellar basal body-associated protein FliL